MKNYLLGIAVFVLAFALSSGFADNKSDQSKEAQKGKTLKSCCKGEASAENADDCLDEATEAVNEAGVKIEKVSEKSSCDDMWEKMASKDGKADCCKGEKVVKTKTVKKTKKTG